jgi:hypothetical protein
MLILTRAHADPDPVFPMLTSSTRLETNTEDNVKEDLETWSQYLQYKAMCNGAAFNVI